ncbi:MAG: methyltransferase [Rubrivivax sp.]|nr:methyltransferase [Rubrivivax sp.]
MTFTGTQSARRFGQLLVALQMLLIGALAWWAAPAFVGGYAHTVAWVLAGAAAALGAWALNCNRPGNFNIHPAPKPGGQLVQQGPYRWIRHPMYSAVLLAGAASVAAAGNGPAWACLAALAAVLGTKATLEERWLLAQHECYAAYRAQTARFLPGVY